MSPNQPNASTPGLQNWEAIVDKPDDAVEEPTEGCVRRAQVKKITFEPSKKYPGSVYPRVQFSVYDKHHNTSPMSWIAWRNSEILPAITAIDPDARQQPIESLIGKECCVRVTLARGITVTEILPKTAMPGPTLEERGWL